MRKKLKRASYTEFVRASRDNRRYEVHGRVFFNALWDIANGHDNPKALARKIVEDFAAGEYKTK